MVKKILNLMIYFLLRFKKKYFEDYTWKGKFKTPNECNLVDFKLNKTAINYYKEATKKFKGPEDIELTGRHTILPVLVSNIKENKINILDFGGSSNPGISYLIKSCDGDFSSTIIETGIFVENFKNKVPDIYKDKINYRDSFKNLNLGLVDNMSYFTADDGKKYKIFGEGGVKKTAEEFKKEFLGEIPINPKVGKCGDEGKPIVEANPEHEISKIYLNFANKIKSTYL